MIYLFLSNKNEFIIPIEFPNLDKKIGSVRIWQSYIVTFKIDDYKGNMKVIFIYCGWFLAKISLLNVGFISM